MVRAESGKAEEGDAAELRRPTTTPPGESHRRATPPNLSARPLRPGQSLVGEATGASVDALSRWRTSGPPGTRVADRIRCGKSTGINDPGNPE